MEKFNLLTVDVGINNLGVAIFKQNIIKKTILFKETSKDSVEKRIHNIYLNLTNLIKKEFNKEEKNYLIYEKPYFSFNSDTGKVLDYVVGILHLVTYQSNLTLISYTPKEIKKSIRILQDNKSRDRYVNKQIVLKAVTEILENEKFFEGFSLNYSNIDLPRISDHEVDALAIGLTYLLKHKEENYDVSH